MRHFALCLCAAAVCGALLTGCNQGATSGTSEGGKLTAEQQAQETQRAADMAKQYQNQGQRR